MCRQEAVLIVVTIVAASGIAIAANAHGESYSRDVTPQPDVFLCVDGRIVDELSLRVSPDSGGLVVSGFSGLTKSRPSSEDTVSGLASTLLIEAPLFRQLTARGMTASDAALECHRTQRALFDSLAHVLTALINDRISPAQCMQQASQMIEKDPYRGLCNNVALDDTIIIAIMYTARVPFRIHPIRNENSGQHARESAYDHACRIANELEAFVTAPLGGRRALIVHNCGYTMLRGEAAEQAELQVRAYIADGVCASGPIPKRCLCVH